MTMWQSGDPNAQQAYYDRLLKSRMGFAIANMDPATAAGYGIGSLLNNYLARGDHRKAQSAAELTPGAANLLNPGYTAPEKPQSLAGSLLGDPGALLEKAGLPATAAEPFRAPTIAEMAARAVQRPAASAPAPGQAGGSPVSAALGGVQAIGNIANGDTKPVDYYELYKLGKLFFDPAASFGTGAADQKNRLDEYNGGKPGAVNRPATGLPMEPVARQIAAELTGAKQAYAQAQAAGDASLMRQAAERAASLRQSAEKLGVNLADYEDDKTFEQARQALQNDYYMQINKVLGNSLSSDEYWEKVYNTLRKKGFTDGMSRRVAGEKAREYQVKRVSELSRQFGQFGTSNGAINDIGMQAVLQMQRENPESAQIMAQMYSAPRNAWGEAMKRQDAATRHQYALEALDRQFDYSQRGADNNAARQKDLTAYNTGVRKDLAKFMARLNLETRGMGLEQAYNYKYDKLIKTGVKPHEAAMAALGVSGNGLSQQRFMMTQADKEIAAGEKWHELNPDKKIEEYPGYERYKVAVALKNQYWQGITGGGGSATGGTGGEFDPNDYVSVMRHATAVLEDNAAKGNKHSKKAVMELFRRMYGGFADKVIRDTDWDKYFGVPKSATPDSWLATGD